MGTAIAGQFLDKKIGRVQAYILDELYIRPSSFILIIKVTINGHEVTDSEY